MREPTSPKFAFDEEQVRPDWVLRRTLYPRARKLDFAAIEHQEIGAPPSAAPGIATILEETDEVCQVSRFTSRNATCSIAPFQLNH
jgi:hypothetical protein